MTRIVRTREVDLMLIRPLQVRLDLGYIELSRMLLHQVGMVDPLETLFPLYGLNDAQFPQIHVQSSSPILMK